MPTVRARFRAWTASWTHRRPIGKALAAHLEVPLPYLLYRINARFQEEIRGLRDIQGALSPMTPNKPYDFPVRDKGAASRAGAASRMSGSRLGGSLGLRARLNSLGSLSGPRKVASSSTLTLQHPLQRNAAPLQPVSPSDSDDDSDSSDDRVKKDEEAESAQEAEEALNRKLAELQKMMTSEALGLVSDPRAQFKGKGAARNSFRTGLLSPHSTGSSRLETPSTRSGSVSQSISSASSQHGSIPDIPSPSTDSRPRSPRQRRPLSSISSSPHGFGHRPPLTGGSRRSTPLVDKMGELSSAQGSEISSISDLSGRSSYCCCDEVLKPLQKQVCLRPFWMDSHPTLVTLECKSISCSCILMLIFCSSQYARSRIARNNSVLPQ